MSKKILAIDTSCDDTSVAVVEGRRVLSNVISSQDEIHREFGGVVPMLAKRQHETEFERILNLALKRAKTRPDQIDLIAVTRGPGLAPALEVGVTKAAELGTSWEKPVWGVNHLEGHLWSAVAETSNGTGGWRFSPQDFPLLGVVVSGGHTELYWVSSFGEYEHVGGTVDDAFGEAFDKVARLVGLGYPGGAALAEMAKHGNAKAYPLPRAMKHSGDWNVSYSGLKTAMVRLVAELTQNGQKHLTAQEIRDVAASFQAAAVDTLTGKIDRLLSDRPARHILLGGGAAANLQLKKSLRALGKKHSTVLHVPSNKRLLRDNAAMIGVASSLRNEFGLQGTPVLDRMPRWPLESM